jgi:DNA polymerase V
VEPFKIENRTTGFGNPSRSYVSHRLNPADLLVKNPSSTFFFEWEGDEAFGIKSGEKLVVDRSLQPKVGDLVIGINEGKLRCFQFKGDNENFELWGVITWKLTEIRK